MNRASLLPLALLAAFAFAGPASACRNTGPDAASKSIGANLAFFEHAALLRVVALGESPMVGDDGGPELGYVVFDMVENYKGLLPERLITGYGASACTHLLAEGDLILIFTDKTVLDMRFSVYPRLGWYAVDLSLRSKILAVRDSFQASDTMIAAGVGASLLSYRPGFANLLSDDDLVRANRAGERSLDE